MPRVVEELLGWWGCREVEVCRQWGYMGSGDAHLPRWQPGPRP